MKKILFCLLFIPFLVQAQAPTPEDIVLIFDDQKVNLNFATQPELLQYQPQNYFLIGDEKVPVDIEGGLMEENPLVEIRTDFLPQISPIALHEFIESAFATSEVKNDTVEITQNPNSWIVFHGKPKDGYEIDEEKLVELLNDALSNKQEFVRVPSLKIYSQVVVDPKLEARGIKEVLAIGQSNFAGSAASRRQNISNAASKYNGYIVRKGNRFSFNRLLGEVTEENGFAEELVIKGDDLIKEMGGGICQVSTTAFRAAYLSGVPIMDRANHSFAVPYYKPVGLDAAIYLNSLDLRFQNDTPGDILVQTFIEGNNLFFVFYGSNDGRHVALEGPFISHIKEAPDPVVQETDELEPGETKRLSRAHEGFRAEWIRKVVHNGNKSVESLVSWYRPWPAQILKGKEEDSEMALNQE